MRLTIIFVYGILYMLHMEHIQKGGIIMAGENFSEKVSVNINTSTLSNIDILVDNGYYSNRSDFINQAVREGLQKHQTTLDRIIDKYIDVEEDPNPWFVGVCNLDAAYIDSCKKKGWTMNDTGYGVLVIDKDIDEEMLFDVVQSIKLKGKAICSKSIKDHYGLK